MLKIQLSHTYKCKVLGIVLFCNFLV